MNTTLEQTPPSEAPTTTDTVTREVSEETLPDLKTSTASKKTSPPQTALQRLVAYCDLISRSGEFTRVAGTVTEIGATHYTVAGLGTRARLGDIVTVTCDGREKSGEIIRLQPGIATVKPFETLQTARLGEEAWLKGQLTLRPHENWKGRTLNALGEPIDHQGRLQQGTKSYERDRPPPPPFDLGKISKPLKTGVRVIDLFTPLSTGQRIGIFAGSGVGKSSLLSMLAHGKSFDTIVLALVGERGREVGHFLEDVFGSEGERTVAVVASGAESAMMRRLAPQTAMCVAEYFRDQGEEVLLVIDSLTRYAHASREVGLAAGEPPVARGFPPSVFSDLPRLLERAGPGTSGSASITGVFSVLVDGDDHNDPIADAIRGTLDGHIVLDREIADQGRYPAVNIQTSISRLAENSWTKDQQGLISKLKSLVARFEETRDLRAVGAYEPGSDAELDEAVGIIPKLYEAIKQLPSDRSDIEPFQDLATRMSG
ncbi:MAG: FliI/YscN family ATPase [Pseudomonadota bacterium]